VWRVINENRGFLSMKLKEEMDIIATSIANMHGRIKAQDTVLA
jgi:hypothetical protein